MTILPLGKGTIARDVCVCVKHDEALMIVEIITLCLQGNLKESMTLCGGTRECERKRAIQRFDRLKMALVS